MRDSSGAPLERLDVSAYRIPLDEPEADGTLAWAATDVIVVEATAAGTTGLGFTYGPPAVGSVVHDVLEPALREIDSLEPRAAWRSMVAAIRNLGRPGVASMAIAAVDIALWDLQARILGVPLFRLLGADCGAIPVYGSGGFTSLSNDQLVEQLGGWVHDQHIPRVKMKIGTGWGTEPDIDLGRIRLARDTIGDTAQLFVDANGAYQAKQAVHVARRFEEARVDWFEEPVSSDDLRGLRRVREALDVEVAAGEYGYDLAYFERMASSSAVDVLQADVSRCAGITEWVRVAAVAEASGLEISGHCAPSLHLHPACAVGNLRHLEYFADHVRADHLLFDGVVEPKEGRLTPADGRPGLGLEIKRLDAASYLLT